MHSLTLELPGFPRRKNHHPKIISIQIYQAVGAGQGLGESSIRYQLKDSLVLKHLL